MKPTVLNSACYLVPGLQLICMYIDHGLQADLSDLVDNILRENYFELGTGITVVPDDIPDTAKRVSLRSTKISTIRSDISPILVFVTAYLFPTT